MTVRPETTILECFMIGIVGVSDLGSLSKAANWNKGMPKCTEHVDVKYHKGYPKDIVFIFHLMSLFMKVFVDLFWRR